MFDRGIAGFIWNNTEKFVLNSFYFVNLRFGNGGPNLVPIENNRPYICFVKV